jgi:hypothetical protein
MFSRHLLMALLVGAAAVVSVQTPAGAQSAGQLADWVDGLCPAQASVKPHVLQRDADALAALVVSSAPVYEPIRAVVIDRDGESAFAYHCDNGQKLIVFESAFLWSLRNTERGTGAYWSWVFVAAHEIGHILRNHGNVRLPCTPDHPKDAYCPCKSDISYDQLIFNHSIELEADYFAGYVLSRLGVDNNAAVAAISRLKSHATCTHPPPEQRIEVVKSGWTRAQEGVRPVSGKGSKDDLAKFELIESHDIDGSDILGLGGFGMTIETCARRCLRDPDCRVFSFDRWYSMCFTKSSTKLAEAHKLDGFPASRRLKASDGILRRDPKSTVGIHRDALEQRPGRDPRVTLELSPALGRRFFDQPYRTTETPSAADCAAQCRADGDGCVAFNFGRPVCELFRRVEGHYPFPGWRTGYLLDK